MTHSKLPLILGIGLAIDTIILDQISKWYIITKLYIGDDHAPGLLAWLSSSAPRFDMPVDPVTEFFNLVMVWNEGVSFGLFSQSGDLSVTILSTISLLIASGFFVWMLTLKRIFPSLGVGMIIGGAIANVWDRLRFGAVADFFDFHLGVYHWPAFNIADAAIVIGVFILIVDTLFFAQNDEEAL